MGLEMFYLERCKARYLTKEAIITILILISIIVLPILSPMLSFNFPTILSGFFFYELHFYQ